MPAKSILLSFAGSPTRNIVIFTTSPIVKPSLASVTVIAEEIGKSLPSGSGKRTTFCESAATALMPAEAIIKTVAARTSLRPEFMLNIISPWFCLTVQAHGMTYFVDQFDAIHTARATRGAADFMHEFEQH